MFRVRARRLKNDILIFQDGRVFRARPEGWDRTGFVNTLKRQFTLKYDIYDEEGEILSRVEYDFFHSNILIRKGEWVKQIKIPLFDLNAQKYYIKEKLKKLQVWPVIEGEKEEIVLVGEKSFKEYSLEIKTEEENFSDILMEFTTGLMIRWMSFNIGI